MVIDPIIPLWAMGIICVFLLLLKRRGKANFIKQIFIIILLFVINMRIMVRDGEIPMVEPKVDVLFVVDNTISMLAEDYGGNNARRMDAVREDCRYIMDKLPTAFYSVATFDNSVDRIVPYTVDGSMVMDALNGLKGEHEMYAKGTSLNDVMKAMEPMLYNKRENFQIVFFISDGEETKSETLDSYGGLKDLVDGGAVLGYGTKEGGPMKPEKYMETELEPEYLYYYDENYEKKQSVSKLDEANLKNIASDFGISYVHMTKTSEIDQVIADLQSQMADLEMTEDLDAKEGYADIYYWFVIPLVVLLLTDFANRVQ